MRYYLDFDRTLFDTDAFIASLRQRPDLAHIAALPYPEFLAALGAQAKDGSLVFAPGELSPFLFPDATRFLREKENAVTIITYGDVPFQEIKVKSALHGIPRMAVMYTGDVRKGEYLAPHTHLHEDAIAIDDAPLELAIFAEKCPRLGLYEMRRDGAKGDGRWPIVGSLEEIR